MHQQKLRGCDTTGAGAAQGALQAVQQPAREKRCWKLHGSLTDAATLLAHCCHQLPTTNL
jgi:hypothetical protein